MLKAGDRTTVTLSGIVGAGKSSAAKAIVQSLRSAGYQAQHIRFQEFSDLRFARRGRNGTSKQRASPDRRARRWTDYQRRRMTVGMAAAYVLRTLVYRWRLRRWPADTVLVFDRYFYDSLVHFDLNGAPLLLRLLIKAIPEPAVAALLLIRAPTILARRTDYSAEYAHLVASGYEALPDRFPGLLVARTDDFGAVAQVTSDVVDAVLRKRGRRTETA